MKNEWLSRDGGGKEDPILKLTKNKTHKTTTGQTDKFRKQLIATDAEHRTGQDNMNALSEERMVQNQKKIPFRQKLPREQKSKQRDGRKNKRVKTTGHRTRSIQ